MRPYLKVLVTLAPWRLYHRPMIGFLLSQGCRVIFNVVLPLCIAWTRGLSSDTKMSINFVTCFNLVFIGSLGAIQDQNAQFISALLIMFTYLLKIKS